jgi:glutathione-specific gamma-glutamylcyclotransferase
MPHRPTSRDPAAQLHHTLKTRRTSGDLWVFGYASLIWRPEFEADERRPAMVYGWHRALEMRSRINRGTYEQPGLVFALISGGSCQGVVYRIAQHRVAAELDRLWAREMPTGVYDPKWLNCHTPLGHVEALAFALSRRSPNFTGELSDLQLLDIFRQASGRYGRTLDYLLETGRALREQGIRDTQIERLEALARAHGLS